jgi:hypothetical protein
MQMLGGIGSGSARWRALGGRSRVVCDINYKWSYHWSSSLRYCVCTLYTQNYNIILGSTSQTLVCLSQPSSSLSESVEDVCDEDSDSDWNRHRRAVARHAPDDKGGAFLFDQLGVGGPQGEVCLEHFVAQDV